MPTMTFFNPAGAEFSEAFQKLMEATDERVWIAQLMEEVLGGETGGAPRKLADIGCGTGGNFQKFLELGFHILGVEPNADLRSEASRQWGSNPRITLAEGKAEAFEVPAGFERFDAAAMIFVDHHLPHLLHTLGSILERIVPGGKLLLLNNAVQSPIMQLHERLGHPGRPLETVHQLRSSPLVQSVCYRQFEGPTFKFADEASLWDVARFVAGDHMEDYPTPPTEEQFQRAVRELFLPEGLQPTGLSTPLDVVIVTRE